MEKANNEMIKELANTLEHLCFADTTYDEDDELIPNYKGIAKELINVQGYQKLHEDSVVLSKEEWREYVDNENEAYYRGQHEAEVYYKNIQIPRERKETAEKYHNEIELLIKTCMCMHYISLEHGQALLNDNNKFAKQFGVEIKE